RDFLKFAYGGADAGSYLCAHPLVDSIHITGSEQTHNAIAAAIGTAKPITSELGNVSPTIVLPGPWTRSDLEFQAQNIATQKAHNAGFNCIAAQVLIVPQGWEHTEELLDAIAGVFTSMEQRPEYYPGSTARRLSLGGPAHALRRMVAVDANAKEHPAFREEAFCGVLAQVRIPGNTVSYLSAAVRFANNTLRGTLGANLVAHPQTIRQHPAAINDAIRDLRYGCVAVNT
ncbi:MAG TPA: aldehyde dehydrogenase family protein, partial [Candidatus Baltobacteraceae bacterium]|nr:aldehyde dehydrogenase family protein [Candidatus Baltobacteraceae bacterium]